VRVAAWRIGHPRQDGPRSNRPSLAGVVRTLAGADDAAGTDLPHASRTTS
jgi:hypothetical protein